MRAAARSRAGFRAFIRFLQPLRIRFAWYRRSVLSPVFQAKRVNVPIVTTDDELSIHDSG